MNKQIYEYVYIAIFNNPVANILFRTFGINTEKLLRYDVLSINFLEVSTIKKGRQFKEPAFAVAIGIIMLFSSASPTVTTQPTLIVIEAMITVAVVFALLLSPGLFIKKVKL
jgi:hypothetical protein